MSHHSNLQLEILNICIEASVPIFLEGNPGTAKTALVGGLLRSLDRHMETVLLSLREPADVGGLMDRTPEGVVLLAPAWAQNCAKAKRAAVFFDEATHATPLTQAAAGRAVLERRVGDCDMGMHTSMVLAGNPASSGGCSPIIEMLANRFLRLVWAPPLESFLEGLLTGFAPPVGFRLPENWEDGIPTVRAHLASFLRKNPKLAETSAEEAAEMPSYPSWRSWGDMVARTLAAAASVGHGPRSEVASMIVRGCVGEAAATAYITWVQTQDLADPEEVLAAAATYTLPTRGDRVCTLLDSVVAAALAKGTRTDKEIAARYAAAWIVLGRVMDAGSKDLAVPAATTLARSRPPFCAVPAEAAKLHSILTAAGLLAK